MDGTAAPRAAAGGAHFGILPLLSLLALGAAWCAGGPALDRRLPAAADAETCLDPRLLAALALGPSGAPLGFYVSTAVFEAGGPAGAVAGAVGLAPLDEARLAG